MVSSFACSRKMAPSRSPKPKPRCANSRPGRCSTVLPAVPRATCPRWWRPSWRSPRWRCGKHRTPQRSRSERLTQRLTAWTHQPAAMPGSSEKVHRDQDQRRGRSSNSKQHKVLNGEHEHRKRQHQRITLGPEPLVDGRGQQVEPCFERTAGEHTCEKRRGDTKDQGGDAKQDNQLLHGVTSTCIECFTGRASRHRQKAR